MDISIEAISGLLTFFFEHWPFFTTMLSFSILGTFFSRKVWTRKRAYTWVGPKRWPTFWRDMRDSETIHPIFFGAVLGLMWKDPEGADWGRIASAGYFAGAGAASLIVWVATKIVMKRSYNVDLEREFGFTSGPPSSAPPPGSGLEP